MIKRYSIRLKESVLVVVSELDLELKMGSSEADSDGVFEGFDWQKIDIRRLRCVLS